MSMQQAIVQNTQTSSMPDSDPAGAAGEALAACLRLASAADAAIDSAYSGDAEAFLQASRQAGGE